MQIQIWTWRNHRCCVRNLQAKNMLCHSRQQQAEVRFDCRLRTCSCHWRASMSPFKKPRSVKPGATASPCVPHACSHAPSSAALCGPANGPWYETHAAAMNASPTSVPFAASCASEDSCHRTASPARESIRVPARARRFSASVYCCCKDASSSWLAASWAFNRSTSSSDLCTSPVTSLHAAV